MKQVTKKELFAAINVGDCISAPESMNDLVSTVFMERRSQKRIGKISIVLNKYGRTKYPHSNEYFLFD